MGVHKYLGGLVLAAGWLTSAAAQQLPYCFDPDALESCRPGALAAGVESSSILNALDDPLKEVIVTLVSLAADTQGPFSIIENAEVDFTFTGDTIPDLDGQLEIVDFLIRNQNDETLPESLRQLGGDLESAYMANYEVLAGKLGSSTVAVFQILMRQFLPALTYYTLLGSADDAASVTSSTPISAEGNGTLGYIQVILTLMDGVEVSGTTLAFNSTTLSSEEFITFDEILGGLGDIDNDNFDNSCEYRKCRFDSKDCPIVFGIPICDPPVDCWDDSYDFLEAVLDPDIRPEVCSDCPCGTMPAEGDGNCIPCVRGSAQACPQCIVHSMDLDASEDISLSELLRVVQLFNFGSYGCGLDTEDSFTMAAEHDCTPHALDYAPQDWSVSLQELLRAVQFYNAQGYERCLVSDDTDGYCVVSAVL